MHNIAGYFLILLSILWVLRFTPVVPGQGNPKLQKIFPAAIPQGSFLFCPKGSILFCPTGSVSRARQGQTAVAFPLNRLSQSNDWNTFAQLLAQDGITLSFCTDSNTGR
ncbi:MAG: hypothetical protein K2N88_01045, partial [Muribaculaceae bacterium]|nr:hypothetical protein [Muribaculaceae bacterium]